MSTTHCIAALSTVDRGIGKHDELLWHLPGDLPRFKHLTRGHPIIMGRKTFASIGKPLPERTNIVITSQPNTLPDTVVPAPNIDTALSQATQIDDDVFVIGGERVYETALPHTDILHLTLVRDQKPADTFFPAYEHMFPTELSRECHEREDGLQYCFVDFSRTS